MVTSRDLVADQIRIAAGEPLGFTQADVKTSGHAIEVRLYAEDAEDGFLPATGRIEALRWPSGEGIRVDAGVESGDEVGSRFDPMLAKIVAHGATRDEALDRLTDALDHTVVLGIVTNLRFLRWLVRQGVVRDGEARTNSLDRIWPPDDWAERVAVPAPLWQAAAQALTSPDGGDPWAGGWRLNAAASVRLATDVSERTIRIGGAEPETDRSKSTEPETTEPETDRPKTTEPETDRSTIELVRIGDTVHLDAAGRSLTVRLAPPPDVDRAARAAAAHAHGGGSIDLVAPMPGQVLAAHR
jgi:acetyl/propionyl-CoA carboxylase alpha subunit